MSKASPALWHRGGPHSRLLLLGIPSNASRVRPGGCWGLVLGFWAFPGQELADRTPLRVTEGTSLARKPTGQDQPSGA